jgi:hypothetical protein
MGVIPKGILGLDDAVADGDDFNSSSVSCKIRAAASNSVGCSFRRNVTIDLQIQE